MKELLEFIVKSLVTRPDDVVIEETTDGDIITLAVHVNESDMGKVIGKQGKIAKAIRSLMKAAAARKNIKVNVDII
ncbi:MAG: KH domain-containing protein [Clostridia bacterium]|nr:KH domain-containing protein [Oscillospiraceae bacterium]MBQ7032114.1 KH domain-containing protein [Clostridia bacterium]